MCFRLDTGLRKLHKTQEEVDVLVEAAKKMAIAVEEKVSDADAFAVQVGIEREKVNAENAAAQVTDSFSPFFLKLLE